jgi:hypothetical protein
MYFYFLIEKRDRTKGLEELINRVHPELDPPSRSLSSLTPDLDSFNLTLRLPDQSATQQVSACQQLHPKQEAQ